MLTVCEAVKLRIENLLAERKMTLYRLSQNSGVNYATIMNVTTLRNKMVNLGFLIQIAGGFDMTVDEFLADPIFHEDNIKVD